MTKTPAAGKRVVFVLDCSVSSSWLFEDETNAYAESVEDSMATASALVPALWPIEIASVLLSGERRKRTTSARGEQFLRLLRSLPITIDDETASRAWEYSLDLARRYQISIYDATYLELALRRGLPIATLDDKLRAACQSAGVPEYQPK
jgi:predicted nucleic acid-binding protein